MTTSEKLAYLKGLLEGVELDESKKDTKVIKCIVELLEEMVADMEEFEDSCIELQAQVDEIDEDLGEIEEYIFGDDCDCDDCDCDDCDDCDECDCDDELCDCDEHFYEVTCPSCSEVICLDEDLLAEGETKCPSCGENLEFDIED